MKNHIHWIIGILLCTFGLALSTKANFGLSMIGATPFILHKFFVEYLPFFSQGFAEYAWEALLLIITCLIIRRFKLRYLLSFVTALIAGFLIDLWLLLLGGNGAYESLVIRIIAFISGTLITSLAIAFFFNTTLAPQVYELAVIEITDRFNFEKSKVKFVFDLSMLVICVSLSLILTKGLTGIGIGTIIVTIINAPLINMFNKLIHLVEDKKNNSN